MKTSPITPADLSASVLSVPPLAWTAGFKLAREENRKIVEHLDRGGVTTFLYGGNANLQNIALGDFESLLRFMSEDGPADAWMLPSIGPDFGKAMDQVEILRDFAFPTAMTLPAGNGMSPAGVASGLRRLSERFGRPLIAYLRSSSYISAGDLGALARDGALAAIKYAVEVPAGTRDTYLDALVDAVGGDRIVSGMGERPAILHMKDYGVAGFTSGCVCISPALSMAMLAVLRAGDYATALTMRENFVALEDLREEVSPVAVLHAALRLAGIADTGPIQPFQSPVAPEHEPRIAALAADLLEAEAALSAPARKRAV